MILATATIRSIMMMQFIKIQIESSLTFLTDLALSAASGVAGSVLLGDLAGSGVHAFEYLPESVVVISDADADPIPGKLLLGQILILEPYLNFGLFEESINILIELESILITASTMRIGTIIRSHFLLLTEGQILCWA